LDSRVKPGDDAVERSGVDHELGGLVARALHAEIEHRLVAIDGKEIGRDVIDRAPAERAPDLDQQPILSRLLEPQLMTRFRLAVNLRQAGGYENREGNEKAGRATDYPLTMVRPCRSSATRLARSSQKFPISLS
jgi:hypothetical protein